MSKIEYVFLDNEYNGFESAYDIGRDVDEIFMFPKDEILKRIKGEFQGTIKIKITFSPEDGDIEAANENK